eukprot:365069-Chlamydomonas_euryale.AAC.6
MRRKLRLDVRICPTCRHTPQPQEWGTPRADAYPGHVHNQRIFIPRAHACPEQAPPGRMSNASSKVCMGCWCPIRLTLVEKSYVSHSSTSPMMRKLDMPVSSMTSRRAASWGSSPSSMPPGHRAQPR